MTDNEQDRPKSLLQQHQDRERERKKRYLRPVRVAFLGTEGVLDRFGATVGMEKPMKGR